MDFAEDKNELSLEANKKIKGWLLVFYFINIAHIAVSLLSSIALLAIYLYHNASYFLYYGFFSIIFEMSPSFILSILIYNAIKNRVEGGRDKVKRLLTIELALKITVGIAAYFNEKYLAPLKSSTPPFLLYVIYYVIWYTYISNSKRVSEYFSPGR